MQGKTLGGRYKIISYLGGGGYGQTYLAEDGHLPNNPRCVVKQLKPQTTNTFNLEVASRLFETEAEVLYKLGDHAQIPRLFAHFEENKEFYLVQEFVEGVELSQELSSNQRLNEAQVILFLQEILEILEFVHQQRVIHRDINPRNLIRRKQDNKLVLIDFGAVKQISTQVFNPKGQASQTVAIGTVGYMPSEQSSGNPGFYSDIYAVGMIAVQALTGLDYIRNQLPRDPQTGEIAWRNRVSVSAGLARIIDRMVRSHFPERYQSVGEVLKELKNLRSTTAIANTVNLLTPVQKAPSSSVSAQISALPRSGRGQRSITPWQIGVTLAVLGAIVIFKLLPSTQTASQQNSEAPVTSANISSQAANFLNQGNQLRNSGEHEKALATYNKALKVKPDYLEASWSQCYALNQLQRYPEALAACDKALKIKPDYYNAWWSKGYALDELQRYQEALSAYDQALKIKPDFSEAWSNRGATLNHLQRYQEALIAYDKTLKLKPNSPEAWNNRGAILNRLQRYQEALGSYDKALKIKPSYPEAWNNRGVVLTNLRRFKEAITSYEKALQIKPDYQPAIENRDYLIQVLGQ